MDLPENSNGIDKPWDHPWSTDEMRQKRNEWSLAADAGLLEHLKQFSNNLTENVEKTKEKLNSLTSDLNETTVIIDNITNASLALANTQFIESRVHEDDIETDQTQGRVDQKLNDEELNKEDLIVSVSESIKQCLSIMDEKFQRVEIAASDSEDEGEIPVPSVVLKPNDPYQNRPLPYVIGSNKWKASSKVGLESSSSDSEAPEGEEESANEDDNEILQSDMMVNNRRESFLRRSSSTSSVSSDRNGRGNTAKHYSDVSSRTEKLEARSQDTLNSGSEMATPTVAQSRAASSSKGAPSFAEELAKRLGNVLPSANALPNTQDADQKSINQSNDDLFASDSGDIFGANSENPFSASTNMFDTEVSSSLWKDRPIRASKTNIIPPCLDVPPPIHAEASKPKSAFDDLSGDADSEDSDDIFACKPSPKATGHQQPSFMSGIKRESEVSKENKFQNNVKGDNITNMATSTPETNDNGGMFGDESEGDDDDLFGDSGKSRNKKTERSPELARTATIAKPLGPAITQADLLSSNLGSRLFQRVPRQDSSGSSDSEPSMTNADEQFNKPMVRDFSNQSSEVSSQNRSEPSSIVTGNARVYQGNVEDSDSSGVSIQPNTSNTFGLGVDFQPQSESTRLRSEEIYRERVSSDSLFTARSRPLDGTNSVNNSSNQPREARVTGTLDSHPEEDFDSDDVFGPPPLPKADSKSKSDIASVDDLFSNTSSGSRSHKSSDLLASTEPQFVGKTGAGQSRGLFDEDIDIFGTRDAPDLDIFSEGFKFTLPSKEAKVSSLKTQPDSGESFERKSPNLFSSGSTNTGETIPSLNSSKKSTRKVNSLFDDSEEDDDDDLFGSNFLKNDRKPSGMLKSDDDKLFVNTPKSSSETVLSGPKKDSTGEVARTDEANDSVTKSDAKRDSDVANTIESAMPSYPSGGLFDNLDDNGDDDDDDEDSLFNIKNVKKPKEKSFIPEAVPKSTIKTRDSIESKMEESKLKTNYTEIEGLSTDSGVRETREQISSDKEDEVTDNDKNKNPPKSSKPSLMKKPGLVSPIKLLKEYKEKEEEITTTDGAKISKSRSCTEVINEVPKRDPPKTLNIRLPTPSAVEDSAPRRAVSGKIKNLMGKMGDLKILSPTDTPPLWKKNEEKSDEEPTESRDSEDGSSISIPSAKTPPIIPSKAEDSSTFSDELKEQPPSSPHDDSGNSESAVSFDVPAQVETLTVTASKSRARIQAKRRPQSRHARQTALRKSGIDFDTVDTSAEAGESDPSDNTMSGISDKVPTVITDSVDDTGTSFDRLIAPHTDNARGSTDKPAETSSSLAPDDRSEISLSKGSSMSINKNTLLSPSTDEEDLFDVPPDLPEDPPKEDTLFGRAPILSPIDGFLGSKHTRRKEKSKDSRSELSVPDTTVSVDEDIKSGKNDRFSGKIVDKTKIREADVANVEKPKTNEKERDSETESLAKKPMDPLRDISHDPLKNPSQLFAFVTKTPSPEKGQNLLFKEDDSLFTRVAKKSAEEAKTAAMKKPALDLFADQSSGDLFSAPFAKPAKKSAKGTTSGGLFDDIDADEDGTSDLFGSVATTKTEREKVEPIDNTVVSKISDISGRMSPSRGIFANEADDDLFVDSIDTKFSPEPEKTSTKAAEDKLFPTTSKVVKDTNLKDLFGDQSSGEEDIFASKKIIGSGKASGTSSIFSADAEDDDVTDIFGKKTTEKTRKVESIENRTSVKKPITRDLKKTAEKIVEDPLSMFQDD